MSEKNLQSREYRRWTAIPLNAYRARGSNRVFAFFTLEAGQVRAKIKGLQTRKRGSLSSLPLFSTYELLAQASRSGEDLHEVAEYEITENRPKLNQGSPIQNYAAASALSELVLKTTEIEDPHPYLYRMLDKALSCLEWNIAPAEIMISFFIKSLEHLGVGIQLAGLSSSDVVLDVATGQAMTPSQAARSGSLTNAPNLISLNAPTCEAYAKLRVAVFDKMDENQLPKATVEQLLRMLSMCLEHHLETHLKSLDFWTEIQGRIPNHGPKA